MRFLQEMGLLLLFIILLVSENGMAQFCVRFQKQAEFHKKVQQKLSFVQAKLASTTKTAGRVLYPIGYGADPTGQQDSSDAILKAVGDAFQVQNGRKMLPTVNDLGGVVLDLQGGNFKITKPISIPPHGGNVLVQGGTLRASDTFPEDRYLIELQSNQTTGSSIQYQDITFRDILFDSSFRGGGITIFNSARIRITHCYFLHFSTRGILVQGGHETFISNTFLGQQETVGGSPQERGFSGTGIEIVGNDNAITDVAIFSAAIGIVLRGEANILNGVHCYNKATGFGGVGILVKLGGLSQTRIDNCYLDYNAIVMEDPVQVHVTNSFFLGDGNVVLKSIKGQVSGLNIVNNMFSGDPKVMKPIVELDGEFGKIDQVVVDANNAIGMAMRSSVGRLSVEGRNVTKWVVDFSKVLLFPNRIAHVYYSLYKRGGMGGGGGFPLHAVTNVSSNMVTIESDKAVDGVVSVVVDQYNQVGESFI